MTLSGNSDQGRDMAGEPGFHGLASHYADKGVTIPLPLLHERTNKLNKNRQRSLHAHRYLLRASSSSLNNTTSRYGSCTSTDIHHWLLLTCMVLRSARDKLMKGA
jgi:hypothetical protein